MNNEHGCEVVAGRVHRERQHFHDTERVLRNHADEQDDRADDNAGRDGKAATADGKGRNDEERADCVIGDRVKPGGKQTDEGHASSPDEMGAVTSVFGANHVLDSMSVARASAREIATARDEDGEDLERQD